VSEEVIARTPISVTLMSQDSMHHVLIKELLKFVILYNAENVLRNLHLFQLRAGGSKKFIMMIENTASHCFLKGEKAVDRQVVRSPASYDRKKERQDALISRLLLLLKDPEGESVMIEPFDDLNDFFNGVNVVSLELEVISDNEIDLIGFQMPERMVKEHAPGEPNNQAQRAVA
jgi:hypothetical protein